MRKAYFVALLVLLVFSCRRNDQPSPRIYRGIDMSKNQGHANWDTIAKQVKHRIDFVLIRSTMGDDRVDKKFARNLRCAREKKYIIGVYHYYDPEENSSAQAMNYLKNVHLTKGDIIPIVDIEHLGRVQSPESLLRGLKNWLSIVEKAYGVKPMIYSASSWFGTFLNDPELDPYPKWVAKWITGWKGIPTDNDKYVREAAIWQYTDKLKVPGIPAKYTVDGNIMNSKALKDILLK